MRIAILGAGALGSWFGGRLAFADNEVSLLTTNREHIDAVRHNGLELRSEQQSQTVQVDICQPEALNQPVDLVITLTKTFQLDNAMRSLADNIDKNTAVLTLQNGLGNVETIAKYVDDTHIWMGMTMLPVDRIAPGVVERKGEGGTWFGFAGGEVTAFAADIENAFQGSDIAIKHDPEIERRVWQKVAFNAGMNAVCALTHSTPGPIGQSTFALQFVKSVAAEVAEVAKALSININLGEVYETIDYACSHHGGHIPSMLQDLLNGRQTEVTALNQAIVDRAAQHDVPVPLNIQLSGLIDLAEKGHRQLR